MVMRARSGTIRYIQAEHAFEKLERFSPIDYRP
jgi:fructose-1,6-bisphosphatase/sedoheptulose 1,7-bisphosphatase-like protein